MLTQETEGPPRTDEVRSLPGVEWAEAFTFVFGGVDLGISEDFADAFVFVGSHESMGLQIVRGRAPSAPTEFVASKTLWDVGGIALGDQFDVLTFTQATADAEGFGTHEPDGPSFSGTLVGIVDGPALLDEETPVTMFPLSLLSTGDIGISQTSIAVRAEPGIDADDLRALVSSMPDGESFSVNSGELISVEVRRVVEAQGRGLWLIALVGGIAAAAVLGQIVTRQVRLAADERQALSALGVTDRQVLAESAARGAIPIVLGSAIGVVLAIAVSGQFPRGFVRVIEPDPGVLVLWGPFLVTVAALLGAMLIWTVVSLALSAWSVRTVRPSSVLDVVAARSSSPSAAVGVRFAFSRPQGDRGSVRASLVGVLLTVAGLVGAVTFGVSLDRLVSEPHRYGNNYDVYIGDNGAGELQEGLAEDLEAIPDVTALGLLRGRAWPGGHPQRAAARCRDRPRGRGAHRRQRPPAGQRRRDRVRAAVGRRHRGRGRPGDHADHRAGRAYAPRRRHRGRARTRSQRGGRRGRGGHLRWPRVPHR